MSATLLPLSLRERAAWIQPARACLPANTAAQRTKPQRFGWLRRQSVGSAFRRPFWRRNCCQRSTTLATLQAPAEPGLESLEDPHKRTAVDNSILIQGKQCVFDLTACKLHSCLTKETTSSSATGFGWTSCDQQDWYDQVKLKVPDLKVSCSGLQTSTVYQNTCLDSCCTASQYFASLLS